MYQNQYNNFHGGLGENGPFDPDTNQNRPIDPSAAGNGATGINIAGVGSGNVNPNDLFPSSFSVNHHAHGAHNPFGAGSNFTDDELLEGLGNEMVSGLSDFSQISTHDFPGHGGNNTYPNIDTNLNYQPNDSGNNVHHANTHHHGLPGNNVLHSPFSHSYNPGNVFPHHIHSVQSPLSGYSGSPIVHGDEHNPPNFGIPPHHQNNNQHAAKQIASSVQFPLSPEMGQNMHSLSLGAPDVAAAHHPAQPMRTPSAAPHESQQSSDTTWASTPTGTSIPQSFNSALSSPSIPNRMQMNEILKGGASVPTKLSHPGGPPDLNTQEMKRKRRRESHNLVERRRRDNINERIQELCTLVPAHRLDDDKVRKMVHSGTPMSPTTTTTATSGLAGPGARRATGVGNVGNITTGLPMEDKDKGPNKGDILNGAVSWTRDLMWMLHLKLQQQEELMNMITEMGGHFPFELTDDECRMQTELMDALSKHGGRISGYSRTAGTGLRVPHHTDLRGDPVSGDGSSSSGSMMHAQPNPLSPAHFGQQQQPMGSMHQNQLWSDIHEEPAVE